MIEHAHWIVQWSIFSDVSLMLLLNVIISKIQDSVELKENILNVRWRELQNSWSANDIRRSTLVGSVGELIRQFLALSEILCNVHLENAQ